MQDKSDPPSLDDHRRLLEAMTDGVVVQDPAGAIVSCNQSALRILGLTEKQIRGRTSADPSWDSIHEDGSPFPGSEHPAMQTLRTRRPQHNVVMGVRRPAGTIAWISIDSEPLIDTQDRLYGVVTTFQDVTQRREAEERLRESVREFADLYHNAPCGYHSLDTNAVFVRINDTELRWLGYKREELIGRMRVTDLLSPSSAAIFKENFERFTSDGSVSDLELQFITKQGQQLDTLVSATAVRDSNGQFLMSRSTVFDNTQRKLAQEQMRRMNQLLEKRVEERTAALHEALRELEAFASSVSHDLRAPVRTIDAFARMLDEDVTSQLSAEGRQFLQRIAAANRRQAQLIGDLLNLSRILTATLSEKDVDLSELARAVVEDLRFAHPERRVEVTIAPNVTVRADEGLMRSVMENLLGNAWKFTGHTDQARIEVGAETRDQETTFFVRDNGVGFDLTYAKDLFKPFRRMHSESDFPGTGIGLATVERIIKRYHGRIWIDSTPGCGTTVYFTLGSARKAA